jgi:CDP-4-dehydro-6-deoxyglucose reductase
MSTSGPLTAQLTTRTIIAPGIADLAFRMRSPETLSFKAGQFVSLDVDAPVESGKPARRSYSIASQSDQGDQLRFIIRVIPSGAASELLMSIPIGETVRMTGPHGFFVLDPLHPGDIVFGATGTGIAAVMPMLGELGRSPGGAGHRYLYWGLRHESDLFAHDEILRLCERSDTELRTYLSAPPEGWAGGRGRITAAILQHLPELGSPTFYLVGNGAMITELKRELIERGVNRKKQIRTEAFFD